MIEGPGIAPIRVCLERNADCYKGALQLTGRNKPLRHLIGVSEEFGSTTAAGKGGRTLLADSSPAFVWTSLAHIHGLPGTPDWSEWFHKQLQRHQKLTPLLGFGCDPILIRGNKHQFLRWLSAGIGTVLTVCGVALAIWARSCLGANWSATIAIRTAHSLVRTGPYARLRHPIYSGLLLAIAGTALAQGQLRGLLALAIALVAWSIKARKEESWLRHEFGAQFDEHARRTGFLLPRLTRYPIRT